MKMDSIRLGEGVPDNSGRFGELHFRDNRHFSFISCRLRHWSLMVQSKMWFS